MTDTDIDTHPDADGTNPWLRHAAALSKMKASSAPGHWFGLLRNYASEHRLEVRAVQRYLTAYYDYETLLAAFEKAGLDQKFPSFAELEAHESAGQLPELARSQLSDIEGLLGHVSVLRVAQMLAAWLTGQLKGQSMEELRTLTALSRQAVKAARTGRPDAHSTTSRRGRDAFIRAQHRPQPDWYSLFTERVMTQANLFGKGRLPVRAVRDLALGGALAGHTADMVLVYDLQAPPAGSGDALQDLSTQAGRWGYELLLIMFKPYLGAMTEFDTRLGADEAWAVVAQADSEQQGCSPPPDLTARPEASLAFGCLEIGYQPGPPPSIDITTRRAARPWTPPDPTHNRLLLEALLKSAFHEA